MFPDFKGLAAPEKFLCFTNLVISFLLLSIGAAVQPIGLTGGIACGKSTVSKVAAAGGAYEVIDLDEIAHAVLMPNGEAYGPALRTFGVSILNDDKKTINRTALGAIVFASEDDRRKLNRITHPAIRKEMVVRMIRARLFNWHRFVIVEAPLLFESPGLKYIFSTIITVSCSEDVQLRRLVKRNPELTEEQCKQRIASQMPGQVKRDQSTIVVWNDKSPEVVKEEVKKVLDAVKNCAPFPPEFSYLAVLLIFYAGKLNLLNRWGNVDA
jgi:dephospho-CoA kinase